MSKNIFNRLKRATRARDLFRSPAEHRAVIRTSDDQGEDKIILNGTDGSSTNANDGVLAEDYTSDIAVYSQAGTSTGSASVLNGVTVAASG